MQTSIQVMVVSKGNPNELERTLRSIPYDFKTLSVLVCYCDIPADRVNQLLARCPRPKAVKAFEQRTDGLYSAMNDLLDESTGELVFFLNSGDYFTPEVASLLEEVRCCNSGNTTYVFDTLQRWKGRAYRRSSAWPIKTKSYRNVAHQAAMFDGATARSVRFQDNKLVMADVLWIEEVMKKCRSVYIPRPIAILELGGISNYPTLKTMKYRYKDGGFSELIKESVKFCLRISLGPSCYYRLMNLRSRPRRK